MWDKANRKSVLMRVLADLKPWYTLPGGIVDMQNEYGKRKARSGWVWALVSIGSQRWF